MLSLSTTALLAALPAILAQTVTNETVLGVYMFHRHGDRTPKVFAPTNLTDLGYREVYTSGQYYRSRYIDDTATFRIEGISPDMVNENQIQASAPVDNVLQNSAAGFLQALYPPVGSPADTQTLGNGTVVTAPMNGFQLIPVDTVESGSGSENSAWLQSTSSCYKSELSSNEYFVTSAYNNTLSSTKDFYQKLLPIISQAGFNSSTATFDNAYLIFDYLNVGRIHNATIPHSNLLTPEVVTQIYGLAATQQWNLAYNASEPIRAVGGSTLGSQVVQFLNATLASAGSITGGKFAVQFGAYGSFSSFFGLADLIAINDGFTGITNYASSMVWEMFTNGSTPVTQSNYPSTKDVYVRFLYSNGTATDATPPIQYPLFGTNQMEFQWDDFVSRMNKFSIGTTSQWCSACGNTTGICEPYADSAGSGSSSSTTDDGRSGGCSNGISPAVNGVIGAMVTLAVILGLEGLAMLVFGLRVVSKKRLRGVNGAAAGGNGEAKL